MNKSKSDALRIRNNLSENAICPVMVGRKNWLFSNYPEGATANALCLTIVEMAKAYHLNLYVYLKFRLSKRPNKELSTAELETLTLKENCYFLGNGEYQ